MQGGKAWKLVCWENTVNAMGKPAGQVMVWLGPAISQTHFEVGPEVRDAFVSVDAAAKDAFIPGQGDRWHGNLYLLAQQRLKAMGVSSIYGGGFCTYQQNDMFYSYRRDGKKSGRLASVVWLEPQG